MKERSFCIHELITVFTCSENRWDRELTLPTALPQIALVYSVLFWGRNLICFDEYGPEIIPQKVYMTGDGTDEGRWKTGQNRGGRREE